MMLPRMRAALMSNCGCLQDKRQTLKTAQLAASPQS
jgi:hypothetical protein